MESSGIYPAQPAAFQQQVASAFAACKEAVKAQLSAADVPASYPASPAQTATGTLRTLSKAPGRSTRPSDSLDSTLD